MPGRGRWAQIGPKFGALGQVPGGCRPNRCRPQSAGRRLCRPAGGRSARKIHIDARSVLGGASSHACSRRSGPRGELTDPVRTVGHGRSLKEQGPLSMPSAATPCPGASAPEALRVPPLARPLRGRADRRVDRPDDQIRRGVWLRSHGGVGGRDLLDCRRCALGHEALRRRRVALSSVRSR
jgi:hypothetical protein